MNINDAKPNLRVKYMPKHVFGDKDHKDIQDGSISSKNDKYVFVKFDEQLAKLGWEGVTSKSCDPSDLILI